jgi:caffeoyl-CoA O-methyltransferase
MCETEMNTLNIKDFENYSVRHTKPIHPLLEEIHDYTVKNTEIPQMMIGALEGKFLQLICCLGGARQVIEIGTFTGYSTLCLADAVGPDGHVLTIDVNSETSRIAQKFIRKAGFEDRVSFSVGKALDILENLEESFDLAFVDADKTEYDAYYEAIMSHLRPTGFILFDNMLWEGGVLNPQSPSDKALHALNVKLTADDRVENFLVPLRDGIQVVQKL